VKYAVIRFQALTFNILGIKPEKKETAIRRYATYPPLRGIICRIPLLGTHAQKFPLPEKEKRRVINPSKT
jgi:hypothetical protein